MNGVGHEKRNIAACSQYEETPQTGGCVVSARVSAAQEQPI